MVMVQDELIKKSVIIVGAGPAGIGMGIVLEKMGIDYTILERDSIGFSFKKWPDTMNLITPSFTGNYFNAPDLNSVSPDTSPAYSLNTEHPSGIEYAKYLELVAQEYELSIDCAVDISKVEKLEDSTFKLSSSKGIYITTYLIWAAGEFQYPKLDTIKGSQNCIHNSQIKSFKGIKGDEFVIIGGYESGLDSAIQLSKLNKKSIILEAGEELGDPRSDSSYSVSPYTKDRFKQAKKNITVYTSQRVKEVISNNLEFEVISESGEVFKTKSKPILAIGFKSSLELIKHLFSFEDNGLIGLSDCDESTITENLFLVGPQVRHRNVIFCFIYKFRQRFVIVGKKIAQKLGIENSELVQQTIEEYKEMNFYLDDLSCCDNECDC